MPETMPKGMKMSINIDWKSGIPGFKFTYKGIPRVSLALKALQLCERDVKRCLFSKRVLCPELRSKSVSNPPMVVEQLKDKKVGDTATPEGGSK